MDFVHGLFFILGKNLLFLGQGVPAAKLIHGGVVISLSGSENGLLPLGMMDGVREILGLQTEPRTASIEGLVFPPLGSINKITAV